MTFDEDFARRLAAHLEAEDPDPRFKRARSVSRRELIANSYDVLMAKRRAGYSLDGIAAQLAAFGMRISAATLERYLRMAALSKSGQRTDAPAHAAARSTRRARTLGSGSRSKCRTSVEVDKHPIPVPGNREENAPNAVGTTATEEHAPMEQHSVGVPKARVAGDGTECVETDAAANTHVAQGGHRNGEPAPKASDHLSAVDRALSRLGITDTAAVPTADDSVAIPSPAAPDIAPEAQRNARAAISGGLTGSETSTPAGVSGVRSPEASTAIPTAAESDTAPATPAAHRNARDAARGGVTGVETSTPAGSAPTSTTSAEGSKLSMPPVKGGATRAPPNAPMLGNIGFTPRR